MSIKGPYNRQTLYIPAITLPLLISCALLPATLAPSPVVCAFALGSLAFSLTSQLVPIVAPFFLEKGLGGLDRLKKDAATKT